MLGSIEKGERLGLAQLQVRHLQDDRREVRPEQLGLGELIASLVIGLVIETHTHARRDSTTPTGALVRAGLGDGLDEQAVDLGARVVPLHAGAARVHDRFDVGDRQRGLGHIGRDDDPRPPAGLEHPLLLRRREAGVQRDNLGPLRKVVSLAQLVGGLSNLPFAGHEDQHIVVSLVHELGGGIGRRLIHVHARSDVVGLVPHLHRVGPT